jgi:tetratricopeptide (TPR) repeat protein
MRRTLGLLALWVTLSGAATPLPLTPPPPDLTKLVPFAAAPLAKPPVTIAAVARPRPPLDIDPITPARVTLPAAERPVAPLPPPRTLPCAAAWLGIASEALECGRARFQKEEYEDAVKALDAASRSTEREVSREGRYWLGETYVRLGRVDQANVLFRQVAQEAPRLEHGPWALHSSGWAELALGKAEGARLAFTQFLGAPFPAALEGWARHGLALALYALGRYPEAEQTWAALLTRPVPSVLARDVSFWYGETLGRVGKYREAATELTKVAQGGPHALLDSGTVRRGWWGLAAGQFPDSAAAFRAYLARMRGGAAGRTDAASGARVTDPRAEREWGEAGLALALLATGDWKQAQSTAAALEARKSPLVLPVLLRLVASARETPHRAETPALIERVLGGNLTAPVRAWLLLEKGLALGAEGNRDEARTQYELARDADPNSETGRSATYLVAQTNFELREFTQAVADLGTLLTAPVGDDLRAAALLLQGEAAYQAGDAGAAAGSYRRFLTEFPNHPQTPAVRLVLAWTALRQQQSDEALRQFLEFARAYPDHPNAIDALELASELAMAAGDIDRARPIISQIVSTYGTSPRSQFAWLNLAIVMLRSGQARQAVPALRDWIARAPFPPLLGRARAALGAALLATGQANEASREFVQAQAEGVGAFAVLGLAATALAQGRWDEATRGFTEARDTGTPDVVTAADYGLAVVKLQGGAGRDFKPLAEAALAAAPSGPSVPRLLYVLTGIAVEEQDWPAALAGAKRLVAQYPSHETADDALERVGAGAARAQVWPVAYEAYALLREQYPTSPFVAESAVAFAEAQVRTGRVNEARDAMEKVVAAAPSDAGAWVALARAREATGDRQGALDGYTRAARASRGPELSQALLGQARLLTADNRNDQARAVLQRLLGSDDKPTVLEAAMAMGETYQRDGDYLAATEYYMTAAYLDPQSSLGRRALLAAGQSFAALKQRDAAAVVYGKLLAQPNVPADLAAAARQGLAALGR